MVLIFLLISLLFCNSVWCHEDMRDFHYNVRLVLKEDKGVINALSDVFSDSEIKTEIKKLRIFSKKDKTVNNINALTSRLNEDVESIYKNLHILGYYNADVKYQIKFDKEKNVNIFIKVEPKEKFSLEIQLDLEDQSEKDNFFYSELLNEKFRNKKASMEEIEEAIESSVLVLQNDGFYSPELKIKRVFIDYENKKANLLLRIKCGEKVNFGYTFIDSFLGIDKSFIQNRLEWEEGEQFNEDKIRSTAEKLKNTQIFSNIKIEPMKANNGVVPMRVKLEEDKKHTVTLSIMYSGVRSMNFEKKSQATKGLKSVISRLSWTRLNAFGGGETVNVKAEGAPMKVKDKRVDYGFEVSLTQPDVIVKQGSMNYKISRKQELTNVFFKKSDKVELLYNYIWSEILYPGLGFGFEDNYVDSDRIFFKNQKMSKNYKNWNIPFELILDKTDDILNPTKGHKVQLRFIFYKMSGSPLDTLKFYSMSYSYTQKISKDKKNVIAFNIAKRGIIGCNIDDVPIDKKIYAGGVNSVRGYANQMATEMIKNVDCTSGGKSSIEFNYEFRRTINKDWGAVLFFDGAKVFGNKSKYFEIEKKRWFYSAGVGARYYTEIGPIRLDFAFPINRRKGVDSKMQFIMSLGEAF